MLSTCNKFANVMIRYKKLSDKEKLRIDDLVDIVNSGNINQKVSALVEMERILYPCLEEWKDD